MVVAKPKIDFCEELELASMSNKSSIPGKRWLLLILILLSALESIHILDLPSFLLSDHTRTP
jgi:hypothetical protein